MSETRVTLLHNPGSGYGGYPKDRLLDLLREHGHDPTYREMGEGFEEVLDEPGDLLAVAGGDGTLGMVAKALVQQNGKAPETPLAVLPLGTANNTARYLGWRSAPEDIVPAWAEARQRSFDVGAAEGPWGTKFFLEAAGLGLFPAIMTRISHLKEQRAGRFHRLGDELAHDLGAFADTLKKQQPAPVEFTLDGETLSGEYLMVEAMNLDAVGPRLRLDPTADAGDGAFEVVVLTEAERPRLADYLDACAEANDRGEEQPEPPELSTRRGEHLRIQWQGQPFHADSQVWQHDPPEGDKADPAEAPATVDIRLRKGALRFLERAS